SQQEKPGVPACRVIVEKPFGRDLQSARALNELIGTYLTESQIYRIDHYLGKETVQNILVLRFGNSIFEPIWNRNHVDYVEITAAETIGIEGRGAFYESTGVVRDIIQNHLLQVMSLVTMEVPASSTADDIHFRAVPLVLFKEEAAGSVLQPAVLTLRIQPHEGISLRFVAKVPGENINVGNVLMTMTYADAFKRPISEAYERLLLDCMRGDATLFNRRDSVGRGWQPM